MGWRVTLRVLRTETWLTVYRTIAIRMRWSSCCLPTLSDLARAGRWVFKGHTYLITRRAGVIPMESDTKTIAKRARVGPRT